MGLFTSEEFTTLDDLLCEQLQDLYDAEHRLTDALPKLAQAATSPDLQKTFQQHLSETKEQIGRLESAFQQLNREPERKTCEAMKGLLKESSEVMKAGGDPAVKDAALIAAAQRIEHYEMAGYGAARTFANQLGMGNIAGLLQATLDEEGDADKKLTEIAERFVNRVAAEV